MVKKGLDFDEIARVALGLGGDDLFLGGLLRHLGGKLSRSTLSHAVGQVGCQGKQVLHFRRLVQRLGRWPWLGNNCVEKG
jgi:hypothetical protein